MTLVPTDLPQRIAARGVPVNIIDGWESHGGSADHQAVVFHWTASSRNESPSSCANYSFLSSDDSPHYNVIVDRFGACWIGAREKSNSSGKISGVALNETLAGHANVSSAASRGLDDTTSANAELFAISAQNDGVGEPWSAALVDNMSIVCAVVLEALGIADVGYIAHHASLTSRKIDLTPGHGCPDRYGWYDRINRALRGAGPVEVPEMWVINGIVEEGEELRIALPMDRKPGTKCLLYLEDGFDKGANIWGCQNMDAAGAFGLFGADGRKWELWVPGSNAQGFTLNDKAWQVHLKHNGPSNVPLTVALSGT
jgi:N-acetylmuramoyl-L-alanine amidase